MPIDARTSGGVYKVVSKILTADGSEIGKVMDSTGRIIYEASRLITVTGVPPISFTKSIGKPLVSWDLLGNTQQTGMPSPDNIIMPDFCGVRTRQLIPEYQTQSTTIDGVNWDVSSNGKITGGGTTTNGTNFFLLANYSIPLKAGTYTLSFVGRKNIALILRDVTTSTIIASIWGTNSSATFTIDDDIPETDRINLYFNTSQTGVSVDVDGYPMLNLGSTALPYEPYGWKIPLTCAGQTVPVYLGEVPTVRRIMKLVLTGEEKITIYPTRDGSYAFNFNIAGSIEVATTVVADIICTHYKTYSQGAIYANMTTNGISARVNKQCLVYDTSITTLADFKSYLAAQYAAGTPVTVWYVLAEPETAIVNEPLAKIGDYADELHSTDAGVTIPTTQGNNTLTVDTDLPPSSMTIVYKGKP